jgi:hypothetical protein
MVTSYVSPIRTTVYHPATVTTVQKNAQQPQTPVWDQDFKKDEDFTTPN